MKRPIPLTVKTLLFGQLLGLLLLSVSTVVESPLAIFIFFGLGGNILLITVIFWAYLMFKELKEIKSELESIFSKN